MRICLFHILLFLHFTSSSQDIDIDPYIKAWLTDDISQTHKTTVFYDRPDREKDTIKHRETLGALNIYLGKKPNKRIEAPTLMY